MLTYTEEFYSFAKQADNPWLIAFESDHFGLI